MGAQIDWGELGARAWVARLNAYAPYSKFAVGAAAITDTGEIFAGCNVENVSFGLTICAERVAVSSAVAEGFRALAGIALAADTEKAVLRCGACCQILAEFNPRLESYRSGGGSEERPFAPTDIPSPFVGLPRV